MVKLQKELNIQSNNIWSTNKKEIELSSKDKNRPLQIKSADIEISNTEKIKKYLFLKGKINLTQLYG